MDDERDTKAVRASLRRPAAGPATIGASRGPLTASSAGEHRAATISGVVTGTVAAAIVAIAAAIPWAIGELIFQGPASWQSSVARWALLLAVVAAVLGACAAWFVRFSGKGAAAVGAPADAGRNRAAANLNAAAAALLRRAQDAIGTVTSSDVWRAGLLDAAAYRIALAAQEWEIATALRQHSELRQARAELPEVAADSAAAELLHRQIEAARLAGQSLAGRVAALEQLATEVDRADGAYRDVQTLAAVTELADRHLDMLARTAADSHAIAEITAMSQHARAVRVALRDQSRR